MKPIFVLSLISVSILSACEQQPRTYTTAQAQAICEGERRDAQGPRTNMTIGTNSRTGAFGGVSVSFNDKYLRGIDPQTAYDDCMKRLPIEDSVASK